MLLQAALKARRAAKQVHGHAAVLGQQRAAVGIKVGAVEHRRRGLVVVQIHGQGIHGAQPHRVADFLGRVGQHHAQLGAVGRQLEPLAAHRQHLRVELDGRGAQAQFLVAELGDGPGPQPQLHGMALGHLAGSTNSSQAIMRCTYCSSRSKGSSRVAVCRACL
jgi:hypothetical protein